MEFWASLTISLLVSVVISYGISAASWMRFYSDLTSGRIQFKSNAKKFDDDDAVE